LTVKREQLKLLRFARQLVVAIAVKPKLLLEFGKLKQRIVPQHLKV
jgi:hypothetical protein